MKLTKLDRRLIARIAKSLPPMKMKEKKDHILLRGSQLIDHGKTETKDGNRVNAGKNYVTEIPRDVNHRKELEKMFIKYGEAGLASYERQILKIAHAGQNH